MKYSDEQYRQMTERLFTAHPSFQTAGKEGYEPGVDHVVFFDQMAGHPHKKYEIVHVAGTNGKGSVSNMIASALAATGKKVGLYTSPHLQDFRERMRILDGRSGEDVARTISKDEVCAFLEQWNPTFDHLGMSMFEITTMMALGWFASQEADIVVLEVGLGGRLDSTNIVHPVLGIITSIGLDHCDLLGDSLSEIAFEKAGIIKPLVPCVIGETHPETAPVFERKVLYTNLPEAEFMGDRKRIMSLLTFADQVEPEAWKDKDEILAEMDLRGSYQEKNLRTVLCALDKLGVKVDGKVREAICHTARRMDFHGRWERISEDPCVIADIGHNAHGLKWNFSQLRTMQERGEADPLIMVFGMVADKDVRSVLELLPRDAEYIFTNASGKRAMDAGHLRDAYLEVCRSQGLEPCRNQVAGTVGEAVKAAFARADASRSEGMASPLIYVGGSTFVVAEAEAEVIAGK